MCCIVLGWLCADGSDRPWCCVFICCGACLHLCQKIVCTCKHEQHWCLAHQLVSAGVCFLCSVHICVWCQSPRLTVLHCVWPQEEGFGVLCCGAICRVQGGGTPGKLLSSDVVTGVLPVCLFAQFCIQRWCLHACRRAIARLAAPSSRSC